MDVSIVTYQKYHGKGEGAVGSSLIRGKWLAEAWPEAKLWTNGQKADAMIFQKAYWKFMMQDFHGPKILDLCDPDWMGGDLKLVELAQYVDAITCSNQALVDAVAQSVTHIPVTLVPDRLHLEYFTSRKQHVGKATKAVYFGYKHNAEVVLPQVLPSLSRLGLDLLVISNRPFTTSISYGVGIRNIQWTPEQAYKDIQFGDIALNPPHPLGNFRFKSNNKTLIAWGLGLPVANTVEDMQRLLDPDVRNAEAAERWKEIQQQWDIRQSVAQYQELFAAIQAKR